MRTQRTLRPKQILFVQRYLTNGRNASEAMRQAGYKSKNPDVDAAKLLVNPGIQEMIREEDFNTQAKFEWTRDQMIQTLRSITYDSTSKNVDKIRSIELGFKMLGFERTDDSRAPYELAFAEAIKALEEKKKIREEARENQSNSTITVATKFIPQI